MDGSDHSWETYLLSIKANRASEVVGVRAAPRVVGLAIHTWLDLEADYQALADLFPTMEQWGLRGVTAIPHGKDRARRRKWSPENRARLVTALERQEISNIDLDNGARDHNRNLNIHLTNVSRYQHNHTANYICLVLKDLEQWEAVLEWGSTVYEALQAVYGYILLDSEYYAMPHSRIHGFGSNVFDEHENAEMSSWSVNQRRMRTLVRDAFVVSYLNPNLVYQLGGVASLRALPVVAEVVEYPRHVRVHLAWQPGEPVAQLNHVIQAFRRTLGPLAIATRRDLAPPRAYDPPMPEIRATIQRIQAGYQRPHWRDGTVYRNDRDPRTGHRLLPENPDPHYYTEHLLPPAAQPTSHGVPVAVPPSGHGGIGHHRLIVAKSGEWYYSAGHYETVYLLNYQPELVELLPDLGS